MSNLKHHNRIIGELELVSSHFGPLEFINNIAVIERFNLPRGFNKQTSKLLIALPNNYPEMPPEDLYIARRLRKNGIIPGHYFENDFGDKNIRRLGYAWYSIHFTKWNPSFRSIIGGDNLLTAINALYDALKYDD
jgi:hypothetical protein